MSQLNSKELLQNIRDAINAPKPPVAGQDYFTPALHYAAINLATLTERERIIKLLEDSGYKDTGLIALIKGENK